MGVEGCCRSRKEPVAGTGEEAGAGTGGAGGGAGTAAGGCAAGTAGEGDEMDLLGVCARRGAALVFLASSQTSTTGFRGVSITAL